MGNFHEQGRRAYAVSAEPIPEVSITTLHPGFAGTKEHGDDVPAGLGTFERWLGEARDTIGQVNEVRRTPDPALTENAHVLAVAEAGEAALSRIVKGYDVARQSLEQAERGYQEAISRASRLQPGPHAAEVRAVIRAMEPAERYAAVLGAMEANDTATLAAVMDAPGITSGLTDEQRDNLRAMWVRKVAPRESAHLEAVQKAQRRLLATFDDVLDHADGLTLRQRATALKAKQAAAREAAKGLKPAW